MALLISHLKFCIGVGNRLRRYNSIDNFANSILKIWAFCLWPGVVPFYFAPKIVHCLVLSATKVYLKSRMSTVLGNTSFFSLAE